MVIRSHLEFCKSLSQQSFLVDHSLVKFLYSSLYKYEWIQVTKSQSKLIKKFVQMDKYVNGLFAFL